MRKRLGNIGYALVAAGLAFVLVGAIAYTRVQDGYDSLQAFSEAQNVTLTYNDDGQLTDRGTTEGAEPIMTLLTEDWNYPVNGSDLDPNDPLVNTASEYMYQMAVIAHHTLDDTQEVTLAEGVEYDGEFFAAGTYDVPVDGRYWTGFDRQHPLDGPARAQAWTGTVHGLVGELGVGTVTHSTLQMGLGFAGFLAGLGATFVLTGAGVVWATKGRDDDTEVPDTIPEAFLKDREPDAAIV